MHRVQSACYACFFVTVYMLVAIAFLPAMALQTLASRIHQLITGRVGNDEGEFYSDDWDACHGPH